MKYRDVQQFGLAVDRGNELIYTSYSLANKYIGRSSTVALDGAISDTATSLTLTDVTGIALDPAGEGYLFLRGSIPYVGSETVTYTSINTTTSEISGLTRGALDTVAASHSDGGEAIGFKEQWKDTNSSDLTSAVFRFKDTMLVSDGSDVLGWKEIDGSDFSDSVPLLDLPSEYTIKCFSSLLMGEGEKVLIGANIGDKGVIIVWDGFSESYDRIIELPSNVFCMKKGYIGTDEDVYITNGYEAKLLVRFPDGEENIGSPKIFYVKDLDVKGNDLFISTYPNYFNRDTLNFWRLDLRDNSLYPIVPYGYYGYQGQAGAIYYSPELSKVLMCSNYSGDAIGAIDYLQTDPRERGSLVQAVYEPNTGKKLRLQRVKLNLTLDASRETNDDLSFDIIVRYYDFRKPFSNHATNTDVPSSTTQFISSAALSVGDRVEFISRLNSTYADICYAPRNVSSFNTTTSQVTLDEALPTAITEANRNFIYSPLKKIKKIEVRDKISLEDLDFAVADLPIFKRCMIEVEFRMNNTGTNPTINSIELTSSYD